MIKQMIHRERRSIQFYTLVLFLVLSFVFLVITFFIQTNTEQIRKKVIQLGEESLVEVEKAYVIGGITERVTDVLYISDARELGALAHDAYEKTKLEWIAFSNRKAVYDQIRYINRNGDEIVRVNYSADGASATLTEDLQNKSDRYYFINTMALEKDQVYVSPFDLNVENGQVELPIKPMLRLAVPIFESFERAVGIVVLNYNAKDLLRHMERNATVSLGELFLLNMDGYWLYNSEDSTKEWAFMYEDRLQESFANAYPEEWGIIQTTPNGFLHTKNGVFCFTGINLTADIAPNDDSYSLSCDTGIYYIVTYISPQSEESRVFNDSFPDRAAKVFVEYLSIYFLLSGLAFVLAVLIAVNKAQKKEIKYFSEFDALTGVYNRRSGYAKLNAIKKDSAKKNCRIVICYLDINGLKEVNDQLGHDAGDELIQSVADVIRASIRGNDFLARVGGDEFLLVLDDMDETGAEMVWGRISQKFEQINAEENRVYLISVSHGTAAHVCGTSDSVDHIINQADEKMYMEKRMLKKDLHVIRGNE